MTVAVGSQLGSRLGYPSHSANPPECATSLNPAPSGDAAGGSCRSTGQLPRLAEGRCPTGVAIAGFGRRPCRRSGHRAPCVLMLSS